MGEWMEMINETNVSKDKEGEKKGERKKQITKALFFLSVFLLIASQPVMAANNPSSPSDFKGDCGTFDFPCHLSVWVGNVVDVLFGLIMWVYQNTVQYVVATPYPYGPTGLTPPGEVTDFNVFLEKVGAAEEPKGNLWGSVYNSLYGTDPGDTGIIYKSIALTIIFYTMAEVGLTLGLVGSAQRYKMRVNAVRVGIILVFWWQIFATLLYLTNAVGLYLDPGILAGDVSMFSGLDPAKTLIGILGTGAGVTAGLTGMSVLIGFVGLGMPLVIMIGFMVGLLMLIFYGRFILLYMFGMIIPLALPFKVFDVNGRIGDVAEVSERFTELFAKFLILNIPTIILFKAAKAFLGGATNLADTQLLLIYIMFISMAVGMPLWMMFGSSRVGRKAVRGGGQFVAEGGMKPVSDPVRKAGGKVKQGTGKAGRKAKETVKDRAPSWESYSNPAATPGGDRYMGPGPGAGRGVEPAGDGFEDPDLGKDPLDAREENEIKQGLDNLHGTDLAETPDRERFDGLHGTGSSEGEEEEEGIDFGEGGAKDEFDEADLAKEPGRDIMAQDAQDQASEEEQTPDLSKDYPDASEWFDRREEEAEKMQGIRQRTEEYRDKSQSEKGRT